MVRQLVACNVETAHSVAECTIGLHDWTPVPPVDLIGVVIAVVLLTDALPCWMLVERSLIYTV